MNKRHFCKKILRNAVGNKIADGNTFLSVSLTICQYVPGLTKKVYLELLTQTETLVLTQVYLLPTQLQSETKHFMVTIDLALATFILVLNILRLFDIYYTFLSLYLPFCNV